MNTDNFKDINIKQFNLPHEITGAWYDMIDFIESYYENRTAQIEVYFKIFLMEMENKGFTKDQIEHEINCYYQERKKFK